MRTKLEDREAFVIAKEGGRRKKRDLCFQRGGRGRRCRIRTHLEVSLADDGGRGCGRQKMDESSFSGGKEVKGRNFYYYIYRSKNSKDVARTDENSTLDECMLNGLFPCLSSFRPPVQERKVRPAVN